MSRWGGRWIRSWLGVALLCAGPASAGPLADALWRDWLAPRGMAFAETSTRLAETVRMTCDTPMSDLAAARAAWTEALVAWESLSGVALGPVLVRRAQRQIDFTPTRPRLIEKAIQSGAELDLVGTPAKGLPALEWLLWVKPVAPGTPACSFATRVAAELASEARALTHPVDPAPDDAALLAEWVNQWVGGVERLRWPGMEMPLRVALTATPPGRPDYPRQASGATAQAWAGQWRALRTLAVEGEASLAGVLRVRGENALAASLAAEVAAVEALLRGLAPGDAPAVLAAAKALAGLKHRVENEVAPALGVSIGFSDADGD